MPRQERDYERMLHDNKDMPKIKEIRDPKTIMRYGGNRMVIAPPIEYDQMIRQIPPGKLLTTAQMREYLAEKYDVDFADPMTAGIFIPLVAQASAQRGFDETPYWRAVKKDGELNEKFPGGIDGHKERLEAEGFEVYAKGKRLFVKDYEEALFELK